MTSVYKNSISVESIQEFTEEERQYIHCDEILYWYKAGDD